MYALCILGKEDRGLVEGKIYQVKEPPPEESKKHSEPRYDVKMGNKLWLSFYKKRFKIIDIDEYLRETEF